MKTLYPTIQTISALLIAFIVTQQANAQQGDYAILSTNAATPAPRMIMAGPVVKIQARSDRKIILRWAPFKGAVSHYVLERSGDGRHYEEAGVFFTGESDNEPVYTYADKLRRTYAGPLFYRLKVVGLDGTEVYTSSSVSEAQHP